MDKINNNPIVEQLNNITDVVLPNINNQDNSVFSELTEKAGFNIQFWNEVMVLQNTLNEKVDTNWVNRNRNWKIALIIENAEAMDSLNWSWWKVRENNWKNLETELIDMFSFNLSKLLETKATSILIPYIASRELQLQNEKKVIVRDDELTQIVLDKMSNDFIMALVTGNYISSIMVLFDIWYIIGNNINDFFKQYKIKYTLNIFRQEHGYKEGTYQKIWNNEEDNVRAKELSASIEYSENFYDDLYIALEGYYGTIDNIEIKTIDAFISSDEKWNMFMVNIPDATRKIILDFAEEYNNYSKS